MPDEPKYCPIYGMSLYKTGQTLRSSGRTFFDSYLVLQRPHTNLP